MPRYSAKRRRVGNRSVKSAYLMQRARLRRAAGVSNYGGSYRGRNRIALRNARTGGLLGIEKKYLDCYKTATAIASSTDGSGGEYPPSAIITGCLSAPAQGDGPTNREGNKIVITDCLVQGVISVSAQANQTAADQSPVVMVALVMDTQTNGTQLNSEDVYTNPSGAAVLMTSPNRNMSYTQRFKVLKVWKKQIRIPQLAYDGTNMEQSGFQTPYKLKWKGKIPVTFTTGSTTADIANVTNNSLQIIAYTSDTSLVPAINYNSRIRFFG